MVHTASDRAGPSPGGPRHRGLRGGLFAALGVAFATAVATAVALPGAGAQGGPGASGLRAPRGGATATPRLFLAVDGLGWEAFRHAQARGLFRAFAHAAPMVAPYPSMSHPSWAEIMGTRRVFGARSNVRTVEARWFDLDAMRVADDPRQVIERQASPFNYMRAFDSYFDPLVEPLMYFPGRRLFDRELAELERDISTGLTGGARDRLAVYVTGTDAMAHTHLGEFHPFLERLDAALTRALDALAARGIAPEVWLVSDHGNAGAFAEGEPESYLAPVSLDGAIARAGLVRRDTGTVTAPDEVAVVTIALASMVNVYFPDLARRRRFAEEALREPGVTLVTWMEVQGGGTDAEGPDATGPGAGRDRVIVVRAPDGHEAQLRWRHADAGGWEYSYLPQRGNPLAWPAELQSAPGAPRWVPDAVARARTLDGPWPDAAHRLVQSAEKQVENAPDLIVNLGDGYAHAGDFGRVVRMVRTHGSLSARATFGVVATTGAPLPASIRADEVMAVMGEDPRAWYRHAEALHADRPADRARALQRARASVATGRADESRDAAFLRRAGPVVASMGYFGWPALRGLGGAAGGAASGAGPLGDDADAQGDGHDATAAPSRPRRLEDTRELLRGLDVLLGLSQGVDTLLALADSLEADALGERLREGTRRVRDVPGLAPLDALRALWDPWRDGADPERGAPRDTAGRDQRGGAGARQALMAAWTVPAFLDAALDEPEADSVADPRDLGFASRWHARERARLRREPGRLLDDPQPAQRLFTEVFAERRLWRTVEPAVPPLLYMPALEGITVVLVPGIYGELFEGELWQRGLRAVRDRLGVRTITVAADGRCGTARNAAALLEALRADTRRRLERGYAVPRYLLVGYSKGGVDATEALRAAPAVARAQVAALVTLATPHLGSPVAERAPLPESLLRWAVRAPAPVGCDGSAAAESLWPAVRGAFWAAHDTAVAARAPLFSVSFTAEMAGAHPWMKLTKRVGRFGEPNDGVVAVSASRFPPSVGAVDLGTVVGDHLAGIAASGFPQEAFLEALVLTLGELGVLEPDGADRWRSPRAAWLARRSARAAAMARVPSFVSPLREPAPLPGGPTDWTPATTFRLGSAASFTRRAVPRLDPERQPQGITFRCDQADIVGFRREYAFVYDAANGGREGDPRDGAALVPASDASAGRACQLATRRSAIKLATAAFRFRPADFDSLALRLAVPGNVHGADPGKARRGANDAAFKLWFVLRDTRDTSGGGATRLFGYSWSAPDRDGRVPPEGTLLEASASRRHVVVTTLPEAWLVTVGGGSAGDAWHTVGRNLAADLARAYPGVPVDAHEVVGITLQSDSDESQGTSRVLLDWLAIRPSRAARSDRP